MELRNRRVTIMGLGCHGGGVAAARYCAAAGAIVTVTDLADETKLAESLTQLGDRPIAKFVLGRHGDDEFRAAEIVVVNPAVRPGNRFVELARQAGVRIASEIELFLDACPATVIAVTGTVGKSTTAAMLAAILQAAGRRAWLGGNIGHSLLGDLPKMRAGDVVVLELSSFQLHWLSDTARWPQGAIVTNCLPNHLDWHRTWPEYVAAKQRLLTHLPESGFCVLNTRDAEVNGWSELPRGKLWPLCESLVPKLQIAGKHNVANAVCAATAAKGLGIVEPTIARALAEFTGLPHRNRIVGERAGRVFINDSKSTTTAATIAALTSCPYPTWLLLGALTRIAISMRWQSTSSARLAVPPCLVGSRESCTRRCECAMQTSPAFVLPHCKMDLTGAWSDRKSEMQSCSRRHAPAPTSFATLPSAEKHSSDWWATQQSQTCFPICPH